MLNITRARLTLLPLGLSIDVPVGTRLIDICDETETGITLGCRRGACGACLVRVAANPGGLNAVSDREREALEDLTDRSDNRLACQLRICGDVSLEIAS